MIRLITELQLLSQKASVCSALGRESRVRVKKRERVTNHGTALTDDCEVLNVDGVLSPPGRA